jgi:two-component system, cell cycle response regulator
MHILIADDDPFSVRLLKAHLQSMRHTVSSVDNGKDAVELLHSQAFDVAIVDWMMPELDGPAVCRSLRSQTVERYVYLILLTARDTTQDVVAGLDSGADDYLTKPFSIAELEARLRAGQRILRLQETLIAARDRLRWQAMHDALTGLLNRGALFEKLHGCMQQCMRRQQSLAILMCDVDHFKRLNDVHGHPVGDAALREVAQRIRQAAPQAECIGRYGGEEFLVALLQTDADAATAVAEQVRVAVAATPVPVSSASVYVSLSIGLAVRDAGMVSHSGDGREERELGELIQRADQSLLLAKRAGRNRVILWSAADAARSLDA